MKDKQNEIYISVDIEAAGPIPGSYSMLSIGACVVGQPERSFYAELKPISQAFVPDALRVSGLSLDDLTRNGVDAAQAMNRFAQWLSELATPDVRRAFVAFNNSFDWSFVNWYFHKFVGTNPFGIGGIDIKAYYMGLVGCKWTDTNSSKLPQMFQASLPQTHNALDDALAQAEIFQKMLAAPPRLNDIGL